jgi:bacterioferritin (cytochrome b1)
MPQDYRTISELLLSEESNTAPEEKEIVVTEENVSDQTEVESDSVVELLKKSLNVHWQQTTTLSAQAVHLERWGYTKLAKLVKADALQEHEHSIINITRLEFFDEDYQPLLVHPPAWKRHDMLSMIQYNLNSVQEAAKVERETILAARAVGDEMTANIMIPLLQGSEDGITLYTGFLKLIEEMGLDNFLSIQA